GWERDGVAVGPAAAPRADAHRRRVLRPAPHRRRARRGAVRRAADLAVPAGRPAGRRRRAGGRRPARHRRAGGAGLPRRRGGRPHDGGRDRPAPARGARALVLRLHRVAGRRVLPLRRLRRRGAERRRPELPAGRGAPDRGRARRVRRPRRRPGRRPARVPARPRPPALPPGVHRRPRTEEHLV
ncbi:MAG: hypothetical protein AVDCRST_MAG66-2716, partial [uncultured Pseudonocardia sp.]